MTSLFFYIFLVISVSFICSLLEACFLSISGTYILSHVKKNKQFAQILRKLKKNVNRPLSAILTCNTIANIVGPAGVGAQVLSLYGNEWVALASGILTFVVLVFSEIIPKTLGASYWRTLAPFCAYTVQALIYLTYPFVWLSERINRALSPKINHSITKEELIATTEMTADHGAIEKKESLIIKNLLNLDSIEVSEIMTPRSVIFAFEQDEIIGKIIEKNKNIRFSRIPIYEKNLDSVVGIIHRYKIFEAQATGHSQDTVKKYRCPLHIIPESISVAATLDQFIKRKEHIFLVVDEYGITTGIVTLEDAVETILGVEIVDELDSVEDLRKLAIENWKKRKRNIQKNG